MRLRNDSNAWGWPARLIHWAMAVLIVFMLGLGAYMANFVDDIYARFDLVQVHKSWGFAAFALALLRVGWRLANPVSPAMPSEARAWERRAAAASHAGLYALMFALPISGWLMASASTLQETYGIRNMVFGLFALPDPFAPGSDALEKVFADIHFASALALAGLLGVHAGAALAHHFVRRDDVLARMTLGGGTAAVPDADRPRP